MMLPILILVSVLLSISPVFTFPSKEKGNDRENLADNPSIYSLSPSTSESQGNEALATKRESSHDVSGSKRNPAVAAGAKALLSNPKVQEAVVDKGIEVAGKLVDKQLKIIDEAQDKASNFLKKKIKLDITPDKAWENEDMFVPPGYHIDAAVSGTEESPKELSQVPYVFPSGIGGVLMNGCWGTDYKVNDPCYNSKTTSTVCKNMIDGAAFMGVGFDGRGKYSPESRKMSIVQRNCANKATYDSNDVPDTMNVHGIYDTSASLVTFESREEYSRFIQEEAGISGSYFGFSAGVKEAWGESTQSSRQKYMAVMDVDVDRYEIFMDEVKPKDLSLSFLREFMDLPLSYFAAGGPLQYQDFIQRWGTHYIKSAKFGGQLEIRKTMDAADAKSKKEFEVEMEMEYKTLFASVGAKASAKSGESSRKQSKTTSTSVVAQGGSQEIASILSDVYSPTFKNEFKEWLKTIPTYPKAFRFQMGSISDLLNFRANDLFLEEEVQWGCEGHAASLLTEEKDGKTVKYYETVDQNGTKTKHYCDFDSRQDLEDAIQRRRSSLQRALEIYMEEGPISISNIELEDCKYTDQSQRDEALSDRRHPTWKQITKGDSEFKVTFDLPSDLPSSIQESMDIKRNSERFVRFLNNKWHTSDQYGAFHLYSVFGNDTFKDISSHKMAILGLVLTYDERDGSLTLAPEDFKSSKKHFPTLNEAMIGMELAQMRLPHSEDDKRATVLSDSPAEPCHVHWSNALRLDPTDRNGKCLHFTASTEGSLFVAFAALPKDKNTWYYIKISPEKVASYKGTELKTQTTNVNARALGDASLYQSYFVCITETQTSTLIEYGKSLGTSDSGDVYLNLVDGPNNLNIRFYAFGNDAKPAKVMDAHIGSRALTKTECKGDTVRDPKLDVCVQDCHPDCDPLAGCKQGKTAAYPGGCHACRVALDPKAHKCVPECPPHTTLTSEKRCVPTYDIQLKSSMDFGRIIGGVLPKMRELTVCFWLKSEGSWGNGLVDYQNLDFLRYMHDAHANRPTRDDFSITIEVHGSAGLKEGVFIFFILPGKGSTRFRIDKIKDSKWHQLCFTWSGYTSAYVIFLDGQRGLSDRSRFYGIIKGGGNLVIGDGSRAGGKRKASIYLTGLHLWDRVLSDQEIAKNMEKCDAGEGNLYQWRKWYEHATKKSGYVRDQSQCQAPTSLPTQ